jgi:hypothetical protein
MKFIGVSLSLLLALAGGAFAVDSKPEAEDNACIGAGPQSPRDIDSWAGTNPVELSKAPAVGEMNLCNIHFHRNAEHKAAAYSTFVEDGSHSGWACQEPAPGRAAMAAAEYKGCKGIAPADTIEVHWVYTSCDLDAPALGSGLNACLTTTCANPQLRVVGQVFVLQQGAGASFATSPLPHQDPTVVYTGSTTGTSFSNDHCSPLQVTWDVKTTCGTLDIEAFSRWCRDNEYKEDHAHEVRELVTAEALLSRITGE